MNRDYTIQQIRWLASTSRFDELRDQLAKLPTDFPDPIFEIHVRVWRGFLKSQCGEPVAAMADWNHAMQQMGGPHQEEIIGNSDCCFDLVYGLIIYVNTAVFSGRIDVDGLPPLVDQAERILIESGNTQWMDAVHYARAEIASHFGNVEEAIAHYRASLAHFDTSTGMCHYGGNARCLSGYLVRLRRFEEAKEILVPLNETELTDWDRYEVILQLARCYAELGDAERGAKLLKEVPGGFEPPENLELRFLRSSVSVFLKLHEVDKAKEAARKVRLLFESTKEDTYELVSDFCELDIAIEEDRWEDAEERLNGMKELVDRADGATRAGFAIKEWERRKRKIETRSKVLD